MLANIFIFSSSFLIPYSGRKKDSRLVNLEIHRPMLMPGIFVTIV